MPNTTLSMLPRAVKERERQALEMSRAGMSCHDIAERIGFADHSAVSLILTRVLKANVVQEVEKVREQEIDRLDAMLQGLYAKARRGDEKAIETVLKIMDRRRKYIGGLEVPQQLDMKVEQTDPDLFARELEAYLLGRKEAYEQQAEKQDK